MRALAPSCLFVLAACQGPTPREAPAPAPTTPPVATVVSSAPLPTTAQTAAPWAGPKACGPLDCMLFPSAAQAFAKILEDKPLVVAVGEAHAQKGTEGIASSAKRFTADVLPLFEARASDLLVELMAPPSGCKQKTEQVREKQKVVTEKQATTDQGEYVAMGEAARRLKIVPDLLRPTCADLEAVDKAGADAIPQSLSMIARLTREKVKDLLARNAKAGAERLVITYGGAMHNDVEPAADRADWSYGPALSEATGGRYVEIDVFVPEYISDSEVWKKLPWYPHFDKAAHPTEVTVFRPKPRSWVVIFPATKL